MLKAQTKKGTEVWLAFIPDCGTNVGGWYVQIYLTETGDPYDDFCIHPEDCNCGNYNAVAEVARKYVSNIEEY